jgi:excisionase family DNA binding protein
MACYAALRELKLIPCQKLIAPSGVNGPSFSTAGEQMHQNTNVKQDCVQHNQRARSIAQAARALNLSQRTVWRLIGSGTIKSVKVSARRRVITDSEINRILGGEAA